MSRGSPSRSTFTRSRVLVHCAPAAARGRTRIDQVRRAPRRNRDDEARRRTCPRWAWTDGRGDSRSGGGQVAAVLRIQGHDSVRLDGAGGIFGIPRQGQRLPAGNRSAPTHSSGWTRWARRAPKKCSTHYSARQMTGWKWLRHGPTKPARTQWDSGKATSSLSCPRASKHSSISSSRRPKATRSSWKRWCKLSSSRVRWRARAPSDWSSPWAS